MSQLDRYFATVATRGLVLDPTPKQGESSLPPGFLYVYNAAEVTTIFGVARAPLAEHVGKRIAFKCISGVDDPGELHVSVDDGETIEDDEGVFTGNATAGLSQLGAYREWQCDPDGNWLLVGREDGAGGLPLGQIVIQTIPVVIQGVSLVNTPPAMAAIALPPRTRSVPPPLVAKPAVVVPRSEAVREALRLIPRSPSPARGALARGPSLLSGEVIELEDSFDDTSLEMNTAGDKFRVAEHLQARLATTLFDFTLRTTSVASTSFEEIGVMRFDATPYAGALTLVVELEVVAAGQTCELQLYNLTAAALVTTLSSSSLVTENLTADLTLPLSEALYSVRLRRIGGDSTQRVSCRSAHFEVTNG